MPETYKGRKLTLRRTSDRIHGKRCEVLINGGFGSGWTTDPEKAFAAAHAQIDYIDQDPVVDGNRWDAHYYAPGTYTLCGEGHPVAIDGQCRHQWCVKQRDEKTGV